MTNSLTVTSFIHAFVNDRRKKRDDLYAHTLIFEHIRVRLKSNT